MLSPFVADNRSNEVVIPFQELCLKLLFYEWTYIAMLLILISDHNPPVLLVSDESYVLLRLVLLCYCH